jgi:hypothetical protein
MSGSSQTGNSAGDTGTTDTNTGIIPGSENNTSPRPTTGLGTETDTSNLDTGEAASGERMEVDQTRGASAGSRFVTSDVTGVVQSIDQSGAMSRVRIRNEAGQVQEFMLDNDTSIFRNDARIAQSSLQAGDRVTLQRNVSTTR